MLCSFFTYHYNQDQWLYLDIFALLSAGFLYEVRSISTGGGLTKLDSSTATAVDMDNEKAACRRRCDRNPVCLVATFNGDTSECKLYEGERNSLEDGSEESMVKICGE